MKDSKMQKANTREKRGSKLTSENKRLSDINSEIIRNLKKGELI